MDNRRHGMELIFSIRVLQSVDIANSRLKVWTTPSALLVAYPLSHWAVPWKYARQRFIGELVASTARRSAPST
jgi:hypothetical protein